MIVASRMPVSATRRLPYLACRPAKPWLTSPSWPTSSPKRDQLGHAGERGVEAGVHHLVAVDHRRAPAHRRGATGATARAARGVSLQRLGGVAVARCAALLALPVEDAPARRPSPRRAPRRASPRRRRGRRGGRRSAAGRARPRRPRRRARGALGGAGREGRRERQDGPLLRLDRRAELLPGAALAVAHPLALLLLQALELRLRSAIPCADHPLAHLLQAVVLGLPVQALRRLVALVAAGGRVPLRLGHLDDVDRSPARARRGRSRRPPR